MAYSVESGFDECYEGTSVLVNKLDIRDEATLAEVESIVTTTKISMLLGERYEGDFTAAHDKFRSSIPLFWTSAL